MWKTIVLNDDTCGVSNANNFNIFQRSGDVREMRETDKRLLPRGNPDPLRLRWASQDLPAQNEIHLWKGQRRYVLNVGHTKCRFSKGKGTKPKGWGANLIWSFLNWKRHKIEKQIDQGEKKPFGFANEKGFSTYTSCGCHFVPEIWHYNIDVIVLVYYVTNTSISWLAN